MLNRSLMKTASLSDTANGTAKTVSIASGDIMKKMGGDLKCSSHLYDMGADVSSVAAR